jgi:hypothetical protein
MIFAEMTFLAIMGVALVNMARSTTRAHVPENSPNKKGSPKKKDMTQIKMASTKQIRRLVYVFKILKLKPDIELIWCEKTPNDDAFIHPLIKDIDENEGFREHGIITVVRRRMGRMNNSFRLNAIDAYPRRLIVRVVDDSTPETRRSMLMLLRDFMMRPENNRYHYEYQVNESSDVTPHDEEMLEPANAYIPDISIVNLITAVYETGDENWYANNLEIAADYFGDMPYPRYAIDQLGYPDHNQFAPGFNPPNDE